MKRDNQAFFRIRRTGGARLALFIAAQAAAPFLAFAAAWGIAFLTGRPFFRVCLLLLFVNALLTVAAGIAWLWRPITRLESLMWEWKQRKDLSRISRQTASHLESLFVEILQEQTQLMEREYKTEVLRQQAELMALQSQINPHFLYNTLDSIRGLAIHHHVSEIADMTEALSRLFRRMIAKEGTLIPLAEEFQSVDNYMLIQRFRFHNKFRYAIQIEDDGLLGLMVPNLIIQPIVENAIVHGLEKKEDGGVVQIRAYVTQNRLVIAVEDSGVGVALEKLDAINAMLLEDQPVKLQDKKGGAGIALSNINQRIKLRFGPGYGVNIMSTQGISTTVEIILPRLNREDVHE